MYAEQICKIDGKGDGKEGNERNSHEKPRDGQDTIFSEVDDPEPQSRGRSGKASKTKTNPRIPTQIKCRMKKKPPISQLRDE